MTESITKERIAEALTELMEKKNIDKITVKDVVDYCHITRQAFYYHYQDLMDVFEQIAKKKTAALLAFSLRTEDLETTVRFFLERALEDSDIINKLMDSRKRVQTEDMLFHIMKTYLRGMIEARGLNREVSLPDMEVIISFYTHALTGLMIEICREKEIDVDRYCRAILHILEKGLNQ